MDIKVFTYHHVYLESVVPVICSVKAVPSVCVFFLWLVHGPLGSAPILVLLCFQGIHIIGYLDDLLLKDYSALPYVVDDKDTSELWVVSQTPEV